MIMKKKLSYAEILKETAILTVAVAIIAAAVYFSWCRVMRRSAVFPVLALCCLTLYHFHCRSLR